MAFEMSAELTPYMKLEKITESGAAATIRARYTWTGSAAADSLIGVAGLYIKVTLWDGSKTTSSIYQWSIEVTRIIAPTFVNPLDSAIKVTSGVAISYALPATSATPYLMRTLDPIVVSIPLDLKPFMTFDSATKTLIWTDDRGADTLAGRSDLVITVTLYNN